MASEAANLTTLASSSEEFFLRQLFRGGLAPDFMPLSVAKIDVNIYCKAS
jgi:hypothetical protein